MSGFDRIATLAVLALGGGDGKTHLLADRPRQEAAYRMGLPTCGYHDLLQGGTVRSFQQVEDFGGLAATAGTSLFALFGAFFCGLAFLPDLALTGATLRARAPTPRLLVAFGGSPVAVAWVVSCSSVVDVVM
jgi:hypothetical protein